MNILKHLMRRRGYYRWAIYSSWQCNHWIRSGITSADNIIERTGKNVFDLQQQSTKNVALQLLGQVGYCIGPFQSPTWGSHISRKQGRMVNQYPTNTKSKFNVDVCNAISTLKHDVDSTLIPHLFNMVVPVGFWRIVFCINSLLKMTKMTTDWTTKRAYKRSTWTDTIVIHPILYQEWFASN